jgi:hypothetical protein
MLSFSSFINEAKFSEDNFDRLLNVIEKRVPKLLGTRIYRCGGLDGIERFGGGTIGHLYFFDNRAFRLRSRAGQVLGIDVWKEYHPNKGPDFVIQLADLDVSTIIAAMRKIADIIRAPKATEISIKEDLEQIDEMAKRVPDDSFYSMMVDEYGAQGAEDVTWAQIKTVADKNEVLIPAYIRSQKTGRGKWNSKPGAGGDPEVVKSAAPPAEGEAKAEAPKKKEPILYIKVTAQDPDTKRFIPSGDSVAAQKLYQQLQSSLDGPATQAEMQDPDTLYGHMSQLVQMACKGTLRSLLIYGGPGTGKTFTIMKTVNDMGFVKGKDYVKLSGKASPIEIYKTLFMFREGGLVIFDDLDSMWRNEDATNILKAALDTSPVREISWVSSQTINVSRMSDEARDKLFKQIDRQISGEPLDDEMPPEDEDEDQDEDSKGKKKKRGTATSAGTFNPDKLKYPSTFDFTGRVIFISNLKKDEFDSAILSRSAKINMDLTPEQILERMRKILPTLGGDDVPLPQKEELLDHLLVMHKKKEITAVTMREFTKGLDIVRSGVPNWRDLVRYA